VQYLELKEKNETVALKALSLMSHRGKDFSDIKSNNKFTFGFNRLAIEILVLIPNH